MKSGRFPGRLLIFSSLFCRLPGQFLRRKPESSRVKRILVLHQFLLGDALMATSLLAKLRQQFPQAQIILACPPGQAALYQSRPYGVEPLAWHPRDFASIRCLFAQPRFDLVYLMGENRLSFLARALGARWIVGFAGEAPAYKNWLVDQAVPYSSEPAAWTDTAATLVDGPPPGCFRLEDWPLDTLTQTELPEHYVVLHVGASSATRFWPEENWRQLAAWIRSQGHRVLWSCGPGEQRLIEALAPSKDDLVMAGNLSLGQLRTVLARADACVCPDTGIAHLAKIADAALVMLFGPGSEVLFGASEFFANGRCIGVGPAWFPCRNQRSVHYRDVDWALRCFRPHGAAPSGCARALCMQAIESDQVIAALKRLITDQVTTALAPK